MLSKVLILVGPTAVGKTALSIELAKRLDSEIISGDSVQVYKYMDIGSAKPTLEERQGIKHHMIDILEPNQEYSVALFQRKVEPLIHKLNAEGKIPILVGGTGLYIKSITDNLSFTDFDVDWEYRNELQQIAQTKGNMHLWEQLNKVDSVVAAKVHSNDLKRIIRALEVYHHTGRTLAEYQKQDENKAPKFNFLMYGLTKNRVKLYECINSRVDQMLDTGFLTEVKSLLAQGYSLDHPAMRSLGYKELVMYLNGELEYDETVSLIKRNTRRFAKRQLTWFRRDSHIKWIDVENYRSIHEIANEIMQQIEGQFGHM